MKTVGGVGFPGSPLAATKEELEQIAGFWPDIEKSRAEARRLLKKAGVENLSFELLNRNVDQPYKFNGTWVIDQWSKIRLKVTQRVLPTGPFGEAFRSGDFDTGLDGDCQNIVNPLLDGTKYLPHSVSAANYGNYDDPAEIELYDRMRPISQLCQRLEGEPEPLCQPGPGNNLAGQVGRRLLRTVSLAVADRRASSVCHVTDVERTCPGPCGKTQPGHPSLIRQKTSLICPFNSLIGTN